MASHDIDVGDGSRLHVIESGQGLGPVLLLHGLNESAAGYGPTIRQLESRLHLFAVDLRGHGDSRWCPPYRLCDYVADVLTVIDELIGQPVILAGHSLGGLVAAWVAAERPDRVRALLLEDPPFYTAQMPTIRETPFHDLFTYLRGVLERHQASDGTRKDMETQVSQWRLGDQDSPTLLDHFGEGFVARLAGELHRADPRTLDPVLDGTLFDGFDPDRDLPRITCPTRLIAGNPALGGAMRGQDVERVAKLIPLCSERVWGDVGHDIHTVRPEAHSVELMELVDQVSRPG